MKSKRTDYVMAPACKCPGKYRKVSLGFCPDCLEPYRKYFARTPAQVKANERNWTLKQLRMIEAAVNHSILQRNVLLFHRLQIITAVQTAISGLK